MKILQVIPYFAPKFGGPVTAVFSLSKELVKLGHKVTIITSDMDFNKSYAGELEEFGVEVIPFHSVLHFGLFNYTPSMKKWLKNNIQRYDIIHLHEFRAYQNILILTSDEKRKIPVILQARGSVLPFFQKRSLKRIFDIIWGYRILKNVSGIVALCESEAEQYRTMGIPKNKITIIPNGIDLAQFSNLPKKGMFRSRYNIPEKEKIILFLGRIHKIKGIDFLVDTYSELLKVFPNITLIITGPDDNFLSEIQKLINHLNLKKKPIFTGPLYGQEKMSAYIDADVYVLPSRYETFPNTVLEAWACGTPVIVTTGCLIADIVKKAGVVSEFDIIKLKNSILCILKDEQLKDHFGESGKELVTNEFNIHRNVQKLLNLYLKMTGDQ